MVLWPWLILVFIWSLVAALIFNGLEIEEGRNFFLAIMAVCVVLGAVEISIYFLWTFHAWPFVPK